MALLIMLRNVKNDNTFLSVKFQFSVIQFVKVHLTPNFFFTQINLHIMLSKLPQKFFDLLESSIFYAS